MSNFYESGKAAMTSDRDDWETPQWLFDEIDEVWHFDLDPCSTDENAKCDLHYTRDDDGLAMSWGGHRCFVNPPYGRGIGEWMKKAATESRKPGTIVVALVPARTDTAWWNDWVVPHATEIQFIRGRLKFERAGVTLSSSPFPSALVRYGGALPSTNKPAGDTSETLF